MRLKRFWIMALVLALLLVLLPVQPAYADTITVTTTNDVLDAAGSCGEVTIDSLLEDGEISLREAICAANNHSGPDTIEFDIPWSGNRCSWSSGVCTIRPTSPLPTLTDGGTTIDGYTQDPAAEAEGTTPAAVKIVIDGRDAGSGDGLSITSADNVIRGLVVCDFSGDGIEISGDSATGNIISGDYIGTNASGGVNGNWDGVCIYNGAHNNVIGGDEPAERNVISFNDGYGVHILGSGNTVSGNYIGTNADGTDAWRNDSGGVRIYGQNNTIGGTTAGERNVISGNDGIGVAISFGSGNTVSGNYIGTDASGTADLGNTSSGVRIADSDAQNNTVGPDNVISGNDTFGVLIMLGSGNTVSGNYIGTDASGTANLGNTAEGVYINNDAQNTIGPDNVIAHNGSDGVGVYGSSATGNTITQNSIFSNALGIHLMYGANGGIGAPVIFTTTLGSVNVVGTACPGCTVELFENGDTDGEGETYVGDTTADASGDFTVTVGSLSDPYLTATATDPVSGTSEFSAVFTAPLPGPIYLPIVSKNH